MAELSDDLLQELQTHLQAIQPALDNSAHAYNNKIALHLLKTLAREQALGRPSSAREAELAESLRSGAAHWQNNALIAEIKQRAIEKMAVDNPRYATYRELSEQ